LLVSSVFFLVPLAYISGQEPPSNAAPAPAAPAVNPVKPTPEGLARAKKVWGYDCAMCHGEKGNGKGDVVEAMKLTMKDYTDPAALKDMTDGQLFDIIKNGKGQMPGEGDRTKPDDVWNLIILIRSMSKK
jgi:cytochrome c5